MRNMFFNFLTISLSLIAASNLNAQESYATENCQSQAETISKNFKENVEYYTKEINEHADEIHDELKDIAEYVSERPEIAKIALAYKNYGEKKLKRNQVKVHKGDDVDFLLYSSLDNMLPSFDDYYEKECAKGINWKGSGASADSFLGLFHDRNKFCNVRTPYLIGRARLTSNKKREVRVEFCREILEPNPRTEIYFTVCGYLNLVTGKITLGRKNALRRISIGSPDSKVYMNLTRAVEDYTSITMKNEHQGCKSVTDIARSNKAKEASQKESVELKGPSSAIQR